MGEVADVRNHFLIRYLNPDVAIAPATYYHAMHHWASSGVLLWPVEVRSIEGTGYRYMKHLENKGLPIIRSITSLQSTRHIANTFKWRSWLWQTRHCAAWVRTDVPSIRAFLVCDQDLDVFTLLCWNAFFMIGRVSILKYAKTVGIVPPEGSDLFNVLWFVLLAHLKISEERVLSIIHRRVVQTCSIDEVSATLLDMDDCADVLEKTDVDEIKKQQQSTLRHEASNEDFEKQYLATTRVVHPQPEAKPKAKAKARAGAGPAALIFSFETTQPQAKLLLPPDSSIWRARTRGGWCGHLPPNGRVSSMFSDFPTQGHALQNMLQTLWRQHCRKFGRSIDTCPVANLF